MRRGCRLPPAPSAAVPVPPGVGAGPVGGSAPLSRRSPPARPRERMQFPGCPRLLGGAAGPGPQGAPPRGAPGGAPRGGPAPCAASGGPAAPLGSALSPPRPGPGLRGPAQLRGAMAEWAPAQVSAARADRPPPPPLRPRALPGGGAAPPGAPVGPRCGPRGPAPPLPGRPRMSPSTRVPPPLAPPVSPLPRRDVPQLRAAPSPASDPGGSRVSRPRSPPLKNKGGGGVPPRCRRGMR